MAEESWEVSVAEARPCTHTEEDARRVHGTACSKCLAPLGWYHKPECEYASLTIPEGDPVPAYGPAEGILFEDEP